MSWWLVRIYLCTVILNLILAIPHRHTNQKHISSQQKKNTPKIGRNLQNSNEQKSAEDENKKISGKKLDNTDTGKRGLAAGDSFTPSDLLPIAQKLFNKVTDPGKGHGFVSSTYSPQELADKLFEAFFSTTKRIVFLNDEDLPGIDALQALALSGEIADPQALDDIEIEEDFYVRRLPEKIQPKRTKYKLVTKTEIQDKQVTRSSREHDHRDYSGIKKDLKCRWKYECSDIIDLNTCRIHSLCSKNTSSNRTIDEISVEHETDEQTLALLRFRKMMKIFAVDEEVEKILESRFLQLRPKNGAEVLRAESLSEYFNEIIVQEQLGATKSLITGNNMLNRKEQEM